MYIRYPHFCFLESPWLLIGGKKGVQSEYLWCSHCNRSLHLCLRLPCNKDATAQCPTSHSCSMFSCFIWMQSCLVVSMENVPAAHCTKLILNEQMTRVLVCFLWHTLVCKKLSQRTTVSLMNICSSAPELVDPSSALPGQNLVTWDNCVEIQGFSMTRSLPTLRGLCVLNLTFNFIILNIRLQIFFFLPLFRKA